MKKKYSITGLDCPNCAAKLEGILSKLDGVSAAKINFLTERLTVESDLADEALLAALTAAGKDFSKKLEIAPLA